MDHFKVVIAEDHPLVAESLLSLLHETATARVVAIAGSGREALSLLQEHYPSLLITDLNIPDMNGIELIRHAKRTYPQLKVLVLTMYDNAAIVKKVMAAGVEGYVLKEEGKEEVVEAVQRVLEGGQYFSERLQDRPERENIFQDSFIKRYGLSPREVEVLHLISQSLTSREIAEQLYISKATVQTHRRNLKRKLRATQTADLVRFAIEHRIQAP